MKRFDSKVLVCGVTTLLCASQVSSCGAQEAPLGDFLKQYSQGLVQAKDLDKQVFDDLSREEKARVGLVIADLDGNGTIDAAVLSREGSSRSDLFLRFVFCTSTCAERQRFSVGTFSGFQYLSMVAPGGSLENLSDERDRPENTIRLVNAAVRMNEYAKGHSTYYWDSATASIKEIATGE